MTHVNLIIPQWFRFKTWKEWRRFCAWKQKCNTIVDLHEVLVTAATLHEGVNKRWRW